MRPYDLDRDGLVPGECAAALILEREDDARRRGARVLAVVAGRGETGDDRPRVGWGGSRSWPEAARAVALAAGGQERRIGWVSGGGNGTALDERELAAIEAGLGWLPPTSSILAQTGESFASSILRLLSGVYALERQALPGTLGLERAAERWDARLVRTPRPAPVDAVLVPSFAQGGANAVVLLERGN
jgi:3-oxoacyl-[acyl-carrier-protein] synthase II